MVSVNETTIEKERVPSRVDVLSLMWKHAKLLEKWINNPGRMGEAKLRQRVFMIQTLNGSCKNILYGLKDEELELRVKDLEDKIKGAVIIPNELEKKNKRT